MWRADTPASKLPNKPKSSRKRSIPTTPIVLGHTRVNKFPSHFGLSEGLVVGYHEPYFKVTFEAYMNEEEIQELMIPREGTANRRSEKTRKTGQSTTEKKGSRSYHSRCAFPTCQTYPCFGVAGSKPQFCKVHRLDGMVDVKNKKCKHEGCMTRPYFGYLDEPHRYCKVHRKPGMVDVSNRKRCEQPDCQKQPAFGWPNGTARFCKEHCYPGMDDVNNRRCEAPSCPKHPSFAFDGERPRFCKQHRKEGMKIVRKKTAPPRILNSFQIYANQASEGSPIEETNVAPPWPSNTLPPEITNPEPAGDTRSSNLLGMEIYDGTRKRIQTMLENFSEF